MKARVKVFLFTEYLMCLLLALYLGINFSNNFNLENFLFMILILFIINNVSLFFNSITNIVTSIVLPVLLPAMVLLDPFWVAIIAGIGTIEIKYRDNSFIWYKFVFNRTMLFLAGGLAALVFNLCNNLMDLNFMFLPLLIASLIYFFINHFLLYTVLRFSENERSLYFIEISKNLISSYFLGLVLYYSYSFFGKVFFILMIVLIYVIKDFLYSSLRQLNSYTQIVESFLKVIDSKDNYTEGHCKRVSIYTHILCQEMKLRKTLLERIVNIAKIHDIGKIYVDDQILKSSDNLSIEEYEKMKKHSVYGYEILKDIDIMKEDVDIILNHHERYDGGGYPYGNSGDDIPLGARVLSICDAFDVMTTGRSYKPSMNKEEVIEELRKCAGGQFDPDITEVMIKLINKDVFDDSFKEIEENNNYQLSLNYS